ncbi:TetR/AcrR family transcriptional regulator [Altericroceibacterium endophyticum]|uniref:TetR family transcriptional regulator n=1 Tax=Altericroceibacterium endophyticum TaxID=1808508 RepID=A0A6I4T6I5_9SPHN|nr:TetR/AcrR family transcriptional regulator [Altericroceibacterium endophyticum]MXO66824.1 TetR family transcriptional regulator [Altericroceibacterium endophyticum]
MTRKTPKSKAAFLDAATRLFAEHGYDGMTIRDVAKAAGTTLGTLHYHWGNKDGLIREICTLQLEPMVNARLARYAALDDLEASDTSRKERIANLLKAHFEPFLEIFGGSDSERSLLQQFYIRVSSDPAPAVRVIANEIMSEMSREFVHRLHGLCDHLTDAEFHWRLNGVLGTTLHIQAFSPRLSALVQRVGLADGEEDYMNVQAGIAPTVHFLSEALIAPPCEVNG